MVSSPCVVDEAFLVSKTSAYPPPPDSILTSR